MTPSHLKVFGSKALLLAFSPCLGLQTNIETKKQEWTEPNRPDCHSPLALGCVPESHHQSIMVLAPSQKFLAPFCQVLQE